MSEAHAAEAAAPAVRWAPFPLRVGALLLSPARALAHVDRSGGGLRDAVYLALLGVLCFLSRDLGEALLGLSHLPLADVLGRLLQLLSLAFREAAVVILPAALALTLLAGRGRRDPSRDVELAAACYVPYFAVRAVQKLLALDVFFGPLRFEVFRAFSLVASAWAMLMFVLALRLARGRENATVPSAISTPRPMLAAVALGLVMVLALAVNATWVARNGHAIRPFGAGDAVPAFSLARANGTKGTVSLADYRGKVVLLDFWASWCAPCLKLAPVLAELRATWAPRGFEVLSINVDLPLPELEAFLREHPAEYPVLVADAEGRVAERFKVVNLPHLVILNQAGEAAQTFWGYKSRSQLESVIRELVAAPPAPPSN